MHSRMIVRGVLAVAVAALAGCGPTASSPSVPSLPPESATPALLAFKDPESGRLISDLRDADDQIVQIDAAGELIWAADGTRFPGYRVSNGTVDGVSISWIDGTICPEGCAFEIRFGTAGGERRAYLTVDYSHHNPGTLVDVAIVGGALAVTQTAAFPPGTPSLSGRVTEASAPGNVPLEGVTIMIEISSGTRHATTDINGIYRFPGLYKVSVPVWASRVGYRPQGATAAIDGDTSLDFQLLRQ
jgi:hypothetical protein